MARQPRLLALTALVMLVAAAPAAAAPRIQVRGWTSTLVNQERVSTPDGGALPLCQAIPVTAIAPRLWWRGARPGTDVRLRLRVPGHAERSRRLTLRRARGSAAPAFTPRDLRLRHEAFVHGTYRLRVTLGRRTLARATVRLVAAGSC